MNRWISCLIFSVIALCFLFAQTTVLATSTAKEKCGIDKTCLTNPLVDGTDIPTILGRVIKRALGILGSITLVMFVYGGFLWLTSAGNSEKTKKGTETMAWAAIGVFIIFSSYAILSTIIGGLTGAPKGQPFDPSKVKPVASEEKIKEGCWCFASGIEQSISDLKYDDPSQCELASGEFDSQLGELLKCKYYPKTPQ